MNQAPDLLPRVLEAHGGASRWAEVSEPRLRSRFWVAPERIRVETLDGETPAAPYTSAPYTSGHRSFGGLLFPTQRHVYPRDPSTNAHHPDRRIITVDVHSVEVS